MCGRFCQKASLETLAQHFNIKNKNFYSITTSYNIAPSHMVTTIISETNVREIKPMRWGLIPSWAKTMSVGSKCINARCETITEKPTFKQAFKKRRCLIPANGFYEWKKNGKNKSPYYFTSFDEQPFAFAGIWDVYTSKRHGIITSFAIITTQPNKIVEPIHKRMPVIIMPDDYESWLNISLKNLDEITSLLVPYPDDLMMGYPVHPCVNNPDYNDPRCIQKYDVPTLKQASLNMKWNNK